MQKCAWCYLRGVKGAAEPLKSADVSFAGVKSMHERHDKNLCVRFKSRLCQAYVKCMSRLCHLDQRCRLLPLLTYAQPA